MITILLMIGCASEKPSEPPPLNNSGTTDDSCGGEAPIVDSLICAIPNSVLSGQWRFTNIFVEIHATDNDGDLDSYTAQLF